MKGQLRSSEQLPRRGFVLDAFCFRGSCHSSARDFFFFFFYVCGGESFFMPFAVLSSILLFVRYATCSLWLWSGPEMPVGLDQMRPASCVE